ncbi:MAG: alpha/beta hydrolase [Cyanobacteria bacterium K_DeepCast_35m_m2_155]|nr:alpha/beta hydrolase [Cyanobacteria bacterium K_DeepCast_35m_m2_155]
MSDPVQLVAMHGWCGDSRSWDPWLPSWQQQGWTWCCGERGYGRLPARQPTWQSATATNVVIAHSLGPHLLAPEVLAAADAVVLLTSFARFVPEGRAGRSIAAALASMAAQLRGPEPERMLKSFLEQVAAPAPAELLQASPAAEPLRPTGLELLQQDLDLIAQSSSLPAGFPPDAKVLLLQAGSDQIVAPAARQELQRSLPQADVLSFGAAGHGLIDTPTIAMVNAWIGALVQS